MQLSLLLALVSITITTKIAADDCKPECDETEYSSYVECIQKRMKRSTDCENSVPQQSCTECDCNFCAVNACPENCGRCCENNLPCTTNRCCHRSCHMRCKSTSCRNDCRKACLKKLIAEGFNTTVSDKPRHNITTVIQLFNTINNTNVIDIPVEINNTNVNNITLDESDELTETESQTINDNCCQIISPRVCKRTDKYPYARCVHFRKRVCASFCIAPIMHQQSREICFQTETGESCQEQKVYIPQPQPRCSYQQNWPFVFCGPTQQPNCGGCYQQQSFQQLPSACPYNCYDDGYGQGPYYRQGPFYRPGYSHIPSCYQTGSCSPNWNYGYPSYGHPGAAYPQGTYGNSQIHHTTQTDPLGNTIILKDIEVQYPPPSYYYPVPMFPPYISSGYPFPPLPPIHILPPEVDIKAIITHPEKETTYAQITISKPQEEELENDKTSVDTE